MADPNLLYQDIIVQIEPAIVLLNSLREMMKFCDWAVLMVTGNNNFQIRTIVSGRGVCETIEMESRSIFSPSRFDEYCLCFHIRDWFQQLNVRISRKPSCSVVISKVAGSNDVRCFFGEQEWISLGLAQFIVSRPMNTENLTLHVRVIMSIEQYTEFITAFSSTYNYHSVEYDSTVVQMVISASTIRWITPAGYYDHPAQEYEIEGLAPGESYQFQLRWDWPLLLGFITMSIGYERFELSVFQCSSGVRSYRFRFFWRHLSYCFSNVEMVP